MRSVNTSLVVLLPILSLLLFGGDTLKDFAFAMFVGVAIGAPLVDLPRRSVARGAEDAGGVIGRWKHAGRLARGSAPRRRR